LSTKAELEQGLVVGGFGRHFLIETPEGRRLICHPRGKKSQAVVGDQVLWQAASRDEGTIERIDERKNLFYRQDDIRTKSFAANLDQVLVLIAAQPEFSESQLARALIAAEAQGIAALVLLNKSDLVEPFARAWDRLAPYRDMGYTVLPTSLKTAGDADKLALMRVLAHKTTLVLGPSGSGKSTLINLLVPGALAETNDISLALNSGKHTTTSTTWYWLEDPDAQPRGALIDSPGFQQFGLHHLDPMRLASYMPDLKRHGTECKFYNCTHLHEPGCGVIAALDAVVQDHPITAERYRIYRELFEELSQAPRY
jgi:ribosome biogenesis GTPase